MRVKNDKPRSVLGLVFLTVFIDLVGFSIIFPAFPAMLHHYVETEGTGGLFGRLYGQLTAWTAGSADPQFAIVALFGGVLGSVYSVLQFVGAPFWGNLSDRIGRRGTLLFTLGGTAGSYVIWFFSGNFALFILARLFGGLMAGNISIASAVVADTSAGKDRAKGMGIVGMAIGLGFVFGPAIGGVATLWNPLDTSPELAKFGVNPFSGAAAVAFGLALFNWLWAWRRFPETLPPEKRGQADSNRTLHPFRALRSIDYPGVQRTNVLSFLYLAVFSGMEFTLTFLAVERFAYTPMQNAYMFVYIGLIIAFVQGGLVRRLVPKHGERKLAQLGLILLTPGFLCVGFWASQVGLYTGLGFLALGSALAMPCLSALISRYSPPQVQGRVMGAFRSVGSLARAVGPIVGGTLYFRFGLTSPYLVGAVCLLLPIALAFRLPPVPAEEGVTSASGRVAVPD
ncbi:MAG: MFS transporter [Planctomycetes bacterium]|nr:MFS transporter [Planctomycetota bacterium]